MFSSEATRITAEMSEAFTQSDCLHLALELNKSTGYPVYLVGSWCDESEIAEGAFEWCHAVVKTPRGFLDIEGLHDESSLVQNWEEYLDYGDCVGVVAPPEHMIQDANSPMVSEYDPAKVGTLVMASYLSE